MHSVTRRLALGRRFRPAGRSPDQARVVQARVVHIYETLESGHKWAPWAGEVPRLPHTPKEIVSP